jgi:hypothetical protein
VRPSASGLQALRGKFLPTATARRPLDPRSVTHATVSDNEYPSGEHASSPRDAHPPQSHTAPESAERDARDLHGHSTGVGIYPQETSDAKEMPGVGFGHMRRGSERYVELCFTHTNLEPATPPSQEMGRDVPH